MSQGVGHLKIHRKDDLVSAFALVEGSSVTVSNEPWGGPPFTFSLERMPNEFDVRNMSTRVIAEYLATRLREEEHEREQEALESRFYEE
jgi:hypothetical protein